jgi:phage gpG-like protein
MEANIKNNITQMKAVDTGRLRGSITYATNTSHSTGQSPAVSEDFATLSTPPEGTVCAGTNVEYAEFVERGWSKAAARPFLQKGVTEHMKEYTDIIEEYLKS